MGCSNAAEKQKRKPIQEHKEGLKSNSKNCSQNIDQHSDCESNSNNECSITNNSFEPQTNSHVALNETNFDISFDFDKGNYGIILSPNITQIYQPNLTETSLVKMITDSTSIAKDKQDVHMKQLTQEQIAIVSSIIYESIALNGDNSSVPQLKLIHHPLLENVLVKVCLRDLTLDVLRETCFKDKQVQPADVKQALSDIRTGTVRPKAIKVLSIEVL